MDRAIRLEFTMIRQPLRSTFRSLAAAVACLSLGACASSNGLQSAATNPQQAADQFTQVADSALQKGDLALAARFYAQAHAADPARLGPLVSLGAVFAQMGDAQNAAKAYQEALGLAANDPTLYHNYGLALLRLGRPELAAVQFKQEIAIRPDAKAYSALGVALDMQGSYAAAQDAYRSALAMAPADKTILSNYGLSLALAGQYSAAIDTLRPIVADPTATPTQRQNFALILGLAGHMDEAAAIGRLDLDQASVERNLAYYQQLRQGNDHGAIVAALMPRGGQSIDVQPGQ